MPNNDSLATSMQLERQNHSSSMEFNFISIQNIVFIHFLQNSPSQHLLIIDPGFEIAKYCLRLYYFLFT